MKKAKTLKSNTHNEAYRVRSFHLTIEAISLMENKAQEAGYNSLSEWLDRYARQNFGEANA